MKNNCRNGWIMLVPTAITRNHHPRRITMDKTFSPPDELSLNNFPYKKQPLKILMLCWEFPPNIVGGLSRHVFGLSVHLAETGHEVHCLTAGNGSLLLDEIIKGVNVHRVKPV